MSKTTPVCPAPSLALAAIPTQMHTDRHKRPRRHATTSPLSHLPRSEVCDTYFICGSEVSWESIAAVPLIDAKTRCIWEPPLPPELLHYLEAQPRGDWTAPWWEGGPLLWYH